MPINFPNFVSSVATAFKIGKAAYNWLTNAEMKKDFEQYLGELENRRVLYVAWEYENNQGIQASLSEILEYTRVFRAKYKENKQASQRLNKLIATIQKKSDVIRGCNMHTTQGEFMAYRALLKVRTEMANTLAVFCGMLKVDPHSSDLEQFIMNMALVRPNA